MNTLRLSKFGLLIVLSFIFISLAARALFPFSDEPDWSVRTPQVLFGDHPVWSPYYIFRDWLNTLFIDGSACITQSSPMSLWAYIPYQCNENYEQVLIRWILTLFILIPMLLIIVFRRTFIRFMSVLHVRLSFDEWNHRIDALALSLLFPSMLFYLGVLAVEQLYLIVALYLFLFWGFWLLISSLLLILLSIDVGNSLVVIFFVGLFWLSTHLRIFGRRLYFLFIAILVSLAVFFSNELLDMFVNNSFLPDELSQRSERILNKLNRLEESGRIDKYPIFLRPIITFMSSVFMTPSGVKAVLLYVLFFLLFVWVTLKVIAKKDNKADIFWFTPVVLILFFVFLLPIYANAKYYIFVMPFLIYVSLVFFNKRNIFLSLMASNAFVFLHLLLYRL
jgi:hypothetical protein